MIASFLFITACGNNSKSAEERTQTEQTELVNYQCPMKCEGEKMYDEPGQCPVCNMDLKLVENGGAAY